jgi:ribonuclease HI
VNKVIYADASGEQVGPGWHCCGFVVVVDGVVVEEKSFRMQAPGTNQAEVAAIKAAMKYHPGVEVRTDSESAAKATGATKIPRAENLAHRVSRKGRWRNSAGRTTAWQQAGINGEYTFWTRLIQGLPVFIVNGGEKPDPDEGGYPSLEYLRRIKGLDKREYARA